MPFVPALVALGWFLLSELLSGCDDPTTEPADDKDDDLPKKPTGNCFNPEVHSQYLPPEETAYYPLALHRIARSDDSGAYARSAIEEGTRSLNLAFKPMNIQFYVSDMKTIADDQLYKDHKFNSERFERDFAKRVVPGAINIFLLRGVPGYIGGYHGIVLEDSAIGLFQRSLPSTWAHEMGHFFGYLHHTHMTDYGEELADGSNCSTAGDLLCDTPADPGPGMEGCIVENCVVSSCSDDPDGNPYHPDVTNYMGYYGECRKSFSPEQQQVILCSADQVFKHLLHSQAESVLEEVPYPSVGCDAKSVSSIQKAMDEVSSGGTVEICEGNYYENLFSFGGIFTLLGKRGEVVIDGSHQKENVLIVGGGADIAIRHITFQNGQGSLDKGIIVAGANVSFQGGSISGIHSYAYGGAVYLQHFSIGFPSTLSVSGVNWDKAGDNQPADISIDNGMSYSGLTASDQLFCSSATGVCE